MSLERIDRREQRRLETRERLLDAAEHVFGQLGYEAANVLDITEAANVSKRTFYLHFNDKENLIEALALRSLEELRAKVELKEMQKDEHSTPREGFHWVMETIFEYSQNHPELMQIIYGIGGSYRLQQLTRAFMVRAWEENFTQKCVWRENAPVPPTIVANAITGVIHQMLCWWFQNPNEYTPRQMADMCISILYDAIDVNFIPHHHMEAFRREDKLAGEEKR